MRLSTHIAVGGSTAAMIALVLGCKFSATFYALLSAVIVNLAIDVLGHTRRHGVPRRTRFSHNLLSPLVYSTPYALPPILLTPDVSTLKVIVALLTGAYTHIILDAFTEGGIYKTPFSDKRVRLARLPYNHSLANTLAVLIATLTLLAALATRLAMQ